MVSFIGDDFDWLAVSDLKRGRVGSVLNALSVAAGLLSVATAAALGELVGPRTVYVVCGLIIAGAGLLGPFVLQESTPVESRIEVIGHLLRIRSISSVPNSVLAEARRKSAG
jgi:hypothetical protein